MMINSQIEDKIFFANSIKQFYMKACDIIKKYLPFNNKVLDNLKKLNPEENDFNGLIVLGEKFPNVINMFKQSKLVLEIDN